MCWIGHNTHVSIHEIFSYLRTSVLLHMVSIVELWFNLSWIVISLHIYQTPDTLENISSVLICHQKKYLLTDFQIEVLDFWPDPVLKAIKYFGFVSQWENMKKKKAESPKKKGRSKWCRIRSSYSNSEANQGNIVLRGLTSLEGLSRTVWWLIIGSDWGENKLHGIDKG